MSADATAIIVDRARLKWYEPKKFIPGDEDDEPKKKRKPPGMIRTVDIGPYQVRGFYREGSCNIKLYEYLPGPTKVLIAYRITFGKQECELLFRQVVDIVNQVRFEQKTLWLRYTKGEV